MSSKKDYFFLTDREYNQTYLHIKNGENKQKYIYFPDKYETMSQKQIKNFQRKFSLKFLYWSAFNREKFLHQADYRIAISRFIDLHTNLLLAVSAGLFFSRFLRRFEAPFLEIMFEDKFLNFSRIKSLLAFGSTGVGFYYGTKNIISQQYLYDLGLEYKEYIYPDQIFSSNCEKELSKIRYQINV